MQKPKYGNQSAETEVQKWEENNISVSKVVAKEWLSPGDIRASAVPWTPVSTNTVV